MKILIISHNTISEYGSMGLTIKSFFDSYENNFELSQLYFSNEIPSDFICKNYYQINDNHIINSYFSDNIVGKRIVLDQSSSILVKDLGIKTHNIFSKIKRNSFTRFLRDFLWLISPNKYKGALNWIYEIQPDIIFFASGNQRFSIKFTLFIKKKIKVPLVVFFGDNYLKTHTFLFFKKLLNGLGKLILNLLTSLDYYFTASDEMLNYYKNIVNKNCSTYYRQIRFNSFLGNNLLSAEKDDFVYIGNLGNGRYLSIVDIAKNLYNHNKTVFVYSGNKNKKILKYLQQLKNIKFMGELLPSEVNNEYEKFKYILHVESFKRKHIYNSKYSLSTKIPDLLNSGKLIIAYGPKGVSSMNYLDYNQSALCYYSKGELSENLILDINNNSLVNNLINNASKLLINHNTTSQKSKIANVFKSLVYNYNKK